MSPRKMAKTMTDQELEGLEYKGGPNHLAKAEAFGGGADASQEVQSTESAIRWDLITATHPDYDEGYWQECRALYSGGKTLLRNKELMERVFPSHNAEDPAIYDERVKRAWYSPYPGAIIDAIISGLGADPIVVLPSDPDDKDARLGEWWTEFFKDVTKKGADRCSLHHMVAGQVREAMLTSGVSWMLVDLPAAAQGDQAPRDRLEQAQRGLLDPYVTSIPAEAVIEWQETAGELDYIILCDSEARRDSIFTPRGAITKTFTVWTRSDWTRYAITYNPDKPPKKDDLVYRTATGKHPFNGVPVVRIELAEGLRAMDKLESMAREHLNKRNALSWAEYKSLFALLYEFLARETGTSTSPIGAAQEDPDRAISIRGQGYVQERGAEDRAEYVGPPTAPFSEARLSCAEIKSEMYRVMHSMADSVEMTSGAARRSGESKAQDNIGKDILLKELGRYSRDAVHSLMALLQQVKGEEDYRVGGGDSFDSVDLMAKVAEAVELVNGLPMKSPTFLRIYLERIYSMVLKGEATDREREEIRKELALLITMEDAMLDDPGPPPPRPAIVDKPGDDDDDDDEEDEPQPKPKGVPLKRGISHKSS